jgi:hypothetical protein
MIDLIQQERAERLKYFGGITILHVKLYLTFPWLRSIQQAEKSFYQQRATRPMKMEQTQCSEKLAFNLQKPGNNPKENIR